MLVIYVLLALMGTSLLLVTMLFALIAGKEWLLWWTHQPVIGDFISQALDHFSVFSLGDGFIANLYYFVLATQVPCLILGTTLFALHVLATTLQLVDEGVQSMLSRRQEQVEAVDEGIPALRK